MTERRLTVLILGGYGTFGGRLAKLLRDEPRLTLVIAGRSAERAARFCQGLGGRARAVPAELDRADPDEKLHQLAPDILVDASGPFQSYGTDPYRVVRACLREGIHYMDLADDAGFVRGISMFDGEARRRGLFALSGLSTFPTLSTAVVGELSKGMASVHGVVAGLAPSPRAGLGPSVVKAIASYAGRPVEGPGSDGRHVALVDSRKATICPPGGVPLGPLRFSLIDVPDGSTLPLRYPSLERLWFGVGTRPQSMLRLLNLAAWMVKLGMLSSLSFLSGLMSWCIDRFRFGEHRGGMFVGLSGRGVEGDPVGASWHLTAEGDDGPFIPAIAASRIVLNALDRRWPEDGARPGDQDVSLDEYRLAFARLAIREGVRMPIDQSLPIYRNVLGDAFDTLPPRVRDLHDSRSDRSWSGRATVVRGRGWLAGMAAGLFGFPPSGADVPVTVRFMIGTGIERWERDFAGRRFSSVQRLGTGAWEGLLAERFGPIEVGLACVVSEGRLDLVVRRWTFLGVPMPRFLAPGGAAFETQAGDAFRFDVEIGHPWTGTVVTYRGDLLPDRVEEAVLTPVEAS